MLNSNFQSAVGWEHIEKLEKHASQKDYATGFGGKFGVQKDHQDKSAVGWDHVEKTAKHESQKDYAIGFGGKFGVQKDHQDKSAVGWDHVEKTEKHGSQTDYAAGFGGKFGVQNDRQDKAALGWDHVEKLQKHESQTGNCKIHKILKIFLLKVIMSLTFLYKDYAKGFGGKYGIQKDHQDKSALSWDHHERPEKHQSQTTEYKVSLLLIINEIL